MDIRPASPSSDHDPGMLPAAFPIESPDAASKPLLVKIEAAEYLLSLALKTADPRQAQRYRTIACHSYEATVDLIFRTHLANHLEEPLWIRLGHLSDRLAAAAR